MATWFTLVVEANCIIQGWQKLLKSHQASNTKTAQHKNFCYIH